MEALEVESTVASPKSVLRTATDQSDASAIIALAEQELTVMQVKAFVAAQVCAWIAERAENHGWTSQCSQCEPNRTAVNVYVDVPEQGGELLMWRDEISDAEFLRRRSSNYGMEIEPLGTPNIVVKPSVGDLIICNARRLHAVASRSGSDRLTTSSCLGYRGHGQPLTFWS